MSKNLDRLLKGKKTEANENFEKLKEAFLEEAKVVGIRAATLKTRMKKYEEASQEKEIGKDWTIR